MPRLRACLLLLTTLVACGSVDSSSVSAPEETGGVSAKASSSTPASGGKKASPSVGGSGGTKTTPSESGGAAMAVASGGAGGVFIGYQAGGASGGTLAGGSVSTGGAMPTGGKSGAGGSVAAGGVLSAGGALPVGGAGATAGIITATGGTLAAGAGGTGGVAPYGGKYGWGNSCRPTGLTTELEWGYPWCNELRPCMWSCDSSVDIPQYAACYKSAYDGNVFCCTTHVPNGTEQTCILGQ